MKRISYIFIGLTILSMAFFSSCGVSEVKAKAAKFYQSFILLPHLISWVIISYLVFAFLSAESGFINNTILAALGKEGINWYSEAKYWPVIIVLVYLWQSTGYTLTDKTASQIDNRGVILSILRSIPMPTTTIQDRLKWQIELLGYCSATDPKADVNDWLVLDVKTTGYGTVYLKLYNLLYGAEREYRVNKKFWHEHELKKGDAIRAVLQQKDKMVKLQNGDWVKSGDVYNERKV